MRGLQGGGKAKFGGAGGGLSKSKSFYVNVKEVFGFKGDGTDETTKFDAMQAFANAQSPLGGCTFAFPHGVYGTTKTFDLPQFVGLIGEGSASSEIELLNTTPTPRDLIRARAKLNAGAPLIATVEQLHLKNSTFKSNFPRWAPATAYALGAYVAPRSSTGVGNVILKCVSAGTSGARSPIGELTPSNTGLVLVGTANAACEPIFRVVTGGLFPATQFQISTDAGTTWGAVLNTTDTDQVVYPLPAFGPTFGVAIACASWADFSTTTATYVQPAVNATVVAAMASVSGLVQYGYVYVTGGGLMQILSIAGSNVTLFNVGASSAVAPGTVIPANAPVRVVYAPRPRVEVLGVPPADNYIVDVKSQFGPLGSATCTFYEGHGAVANTNKWRNNLAVNDGPAQPTVAGAFYDYVVPGIGGVLTLRLHTGLYTPTGSWGYFTSSFGWSPVVGSTVADGATGLVWEICEGPAVFRTNGFGSCTFRDLSMTGGVFNFVASQASQVCFEGSCEMQESVSAACWFTNRDGRPGEGGGFTNANAISGTMSFKGGGLGIIHDGGLGFGLQGGLFQSVPVGWVYFAGLSALELNGVYLETAGGMSGNNQYFSRASAGLSLRGAKISGSYLGSSTGASVLELYLAQSVDVKGCVLSGTTAGFTGVATCDFFDLSSCQGVTRLIDALPKSGDVRGPGLSARVSTLVTANVAATDVIPTSIIVAGSYEVKCYVALRAGLLGTLGAFVVNAIFTDTSGILRTVPVVTYPDITVLGGQGGAIVIDTNGTTPIRYSVTGITTPGALRADIILTVAPARC
jgi:hypothetical protein